MNKLEGYGILEDGTRFPIKCGFYHGTHDFFNEKDVIFRHGEFYCEDLGTGTAYHEVSIEAPQDKPYTLRKVVLPENTVSLFIEGNVTIIEPMVLPSGIANVSMVVTNPIANLDEFKDSDVGINLYEHGAIF